MIENSKFWCNYQQRSLNHGEDKWKKIIQFGKKSWINMPFYYRVPSPSTALMVCKFMGLHILVFILMHLHAVICLRCTCFVILVQQIFVEVEFTLFQSQIILRSKVLCHHWPDWLENNDYILFCTYLQKLCLLNKLWQCDLTYLLKFLREVRYW